MSMAELYLVTLAFGLNRHFLLKRKA